MLRSQLQGQQPSEMLLFSDPTHSHCNFSNVLPFKITLSSNLKWWKIQPTWIVSPACKTHQICFLHACGCTDLVSSPPSAPPWHWKACHCTPTGKVAARKTYALLSAIAYVKWIWWQNGKKLFAPLSNQDTALLMNVLFSSECFYWSEFAIPNNTVAHHANQMVFSLTSSSYKIPVLVKCKEKAPCLASGLIYRIKQWVIVALWTTSSMLHTSVISLCGRLNWIFRWK